MTEMTLSAFAELLETGKWTRAQHYRDICGEYRFDEIWISDTQYREEIVPYITGYAIVENRSGDIVVAYTTEFAYCQYDPHDTLKIDDGFFDVRGATIVDKYGQEHDPAHIEELIRSVGGENFTRVDLTDIWGISCPIIEVDVYDPDDTITIRANRTPSYRFTGWQLARVRDWPDENSALYSGARGVWHDAVLYRTKGGRFICQWTRNTTWRGERPYTWAFVATTADQVRRFFGRSRTAERLYAMAGS